MNRHDGGSSSPQPGQVALYRFYDAQESLLYVGISNEPWRRRKEHSVSQPWYSQVRHQAITWYDTSQKALRAETIAIRQERPQYNIAGAIRPPSSRLIVRPMRWAAVACATTGALWLLFIAAACFPGFKIVLGPTITVALLASAVAWPCALIIGTAPALRRFGAWIERNSR